MHFSTLAGAALTAASVAMAKELPKDELRAAELYDSRTIHRENMARKKANWLAENATGILNSANWPELGYTRCVNGLAEAIPGDPLHTFRCRNFDLLHFINHADLGSPEGWDADGNGVLLTGSSSWGWSDPDSGRHFAANGMYMGVALIEIVDDRLVPLAFLPSPAPTNPDSLWKEVRGYKHYIIIGSELENHGIQIFDMATLLDLPHGEGVKQLDPIADLAAHITDLPVGASHNVVAGSDFLLAVGSRDSDETACLGGPIIYDLTDISNPVLKGCNAVDGYTHDAQCVVYNGPDERYLGHDLCFGYNEDTLTIYDVTDRANSSIISITSYEGATYTHQGWFLEPDWHQYLFMDDEIDEVLGNGPAADGYPVTYIWDVSDLENPLQTGLYKGTVRAVDHNQYVYDQLNFQANYRAGLRVYDVSSVPSDPSGDSVCEIAYFDVDPSDDALPGGGAVEMNAAWSAFAIPGTDYAFVNSIERGAFLVRMTRRERCPAVHPCNADNCLRAMRSTSVAGRLEESQEFCGEFTKTFVADVSVVPPFAAQACGVNVISRVSSACSCLPTPTATP
ncbi:hypothetical protein S7711_09293 [Stachybotrys chartarum IBT 7711]|uniref:Uncharacterized protein n=1 Tax=Stachybotrys chartarum (strain CBS 109288 / IBT 7711) TaxID=1280523 RepID=A0A084AJM4_STACB|nr:hypothetical protein S7711_09293 [Stachybotrys chartarum IBT 7711]KFA45869.1 hypothetical protein S40293_09348 [Stachybotrys chartarum IBT 40293]